MTREVLWFGIFNIQFHISDWGRVAFRSSLVLDRASHGVRLMSAYALASSILLERRNIAILTRSRSNANINQFANRIDRKIETVEPKPEPVSPARRIKRPKQQNWVNDWR